MDKDVKETLDWLEDEKSDVSNIWGLSKYLGTDEAKADLSKVFNAEQLKLLAIFAKDIVKALTFHRDEDDGAHPTLKDKLENIDAKLRNHRHDTNKTYSSKPEF